MNHLAHVFLAPGSPEARVGSILGDFTRGLDLATLPNPVLLGVRHHRAVDAFTDQHPEVLASKALFSSDRRRFAGVALDILYDHYLLRHWDSFSDEAPDTFIRKVYGELEANRHLMPAPMARMTRYLVRDNWFAAYRDLDQIGYALDRVAGRIRFSNDFAGIIEEIRAQDRELELRFLRFFPELRRHADSFTNASD